MRKLLNIFNPLNIVTVCRAIGDARAERAAHEMLAKEDEAMRLRLAQHRLATRQRDTREAMGTNAISHPGYRFNKRHSNDDSIYSHFRAHYLETVRDAAEMARGDNPAHCLHAARLASQ